ncbi:Conserved_hypothetical protein [Hexamita inflata]|uniref:Uncharacterized protein n=2 Tax=Hexamita inflata TaxID=28002 RepID=A0AA86NJV2_9EUKA|nr:Conserved hypothetical protein [Hexamita inflata]CAI9920717.1 Conserved hypothetical protein [Hexamita inflata]CAI9920729.1 Conserved hypothetical protein [Hexamita inflata]
MWQRYFEQSLVQYIQEKYNFVPASPKEMFDTICDTPAAEKRYMWVKVAQLCSCTKQQVHDYYHNTWTKQFYDDILQYKAELNQLVRKASSTKQAKDAIIKETIEQLSVNHPSKRFHNRGIYQYLNQIVLKLTKNGKVPEEPTESQSSQISPSHSGEAQGILEALQKLMFQM